MSDGTLEGASKSELRTLIYQIGEDATEAELRASFKMLRAMIIFRQEEEEAKTSPHAEGL